MEINFCDTCDNLLFLYSNDEDNKLYMGCKNCGTKKDYEDSKCIYNNDYKIDLSETINQNQNLVDDITLPTIRNNPNIKCPNADCESNKDGEVSELLYIKYDPSDMKYMYVHIASKMDQLNFINYIKYYIK